MSAFTPVKEPLTVMMPMCLAENSTWVCIGSTDQLIATLQSLVAYTTVRSTTVWQSTFQCATTVLGFRRVDLAPREALWLFDLSVPERARHESPASSRA